MSDYDYKKEGERRANSGFIIRSELLGVILALIIQTVTAVWWGATVTSDLRYLKSDVVELKLQVSTGMQDRYRGADAIKDLGFIADRIDKNEARILRLEQINIDRRSKEL